MLKNQMSRYQKRRVLRRMALFAIWDKVIARLEIVGKLLLVVQVNPVLGHSGRFIFFGREDSRPSLAIVACTVTKGFNELALPR